MIVVTPPAADASDSVFELRSYRFRCIWASTSPGIRCLPEPSTTLSECGSESEFSAIADIFHCEWRSSHGTLITVTIVASLITVSASIFLLVF